MRKLRLGLLTLLVFLSMSTSAAEDDVYLQTNERAPFSGYLMPVENYRFCAECDVEKEFYKDGMKGIPAEPSLLSGDSIAKFLTGLIIGALVVNEMKR
jgi:hypothetical protein